MSEWISIRDKLPQEGIYVLVYGDMGGSDPRPISIARHDKGVWEMMTNESQCNAVTCGNLTWYMEGNEITHWMELPRLPDAHYSKHAVLRRKLEELNLMDRWDANMVVTETLKYLMDNMKYEGR